MDSKIDRMQLAEPKRSQALQAFREQISQWDLSMPKVEPLVLDFGLGRFEQMGLIESWIINELEAGYCGKYMFVFDSQSCPMHSYKTKHETFFVVKGRVKVTTDAGVKMLESGDVLPVATDLKHSFTGVGNALILEISKPCDVNDNNFADRHIMEWLKNV